MLKKQLLVVIRDFWLFSSCGPQPEPVAGILRGIPHLAPSEAPGTTSRNSLFPPAASAPPHLGPSSCHVRVGAENKATGDGLGAEGPESAAGAALASRCSHASALGSQA